MKHIEWIKTTQTWTCPATGKWKVIAVGGGASGQIGSSTAAGETTSFGDIISANGGKKTSMGVGVKSSNSGTGYSGVTSISGCGGYTGVEYGGSPWVYNASVGGVAAVGTGNAILTGETAGTSVGYGAGGGAYTTGSSGTAVKLYYGIQGDIEMTIVDIAEGESIACTIGAGGKASTSSVTGANAANGADGVIVVQYLGA